MQGALYQRSKLGVCVISLAWSLSASAEPFAFITNSLTNDVSVIETTKNTVVATVAVGVTPWGVAVRPDGGTLYVASQFSDTVAVMDTTTNDTIRTVTMGGALFAIGQFIGPLPSLTISPLPAITCRSKRLT